MDPRDLLVCGVLCALMLAALAAVIGACAFSSLMSQWEEVDAAQCADRIRTLAKERR